MQYALMIFFYFNQHSICDNYIYYYKYIIMIVEKYSFKNAYLYL